jgi:uncharacterized protein (DUF1501 family)
MERREFLRLSGALFAGPVLDPAWRVLEAAVLPAGPDRLLALVELAGGNDGLNTVIPAGDAGYARARPSLAIKGGTHALDAGLALHPQMGALHALWRDGQVAVVPGVGYPQPDRSHFRSMDIWQSARPDLEQPRLGWLGLAADQLAARGASLPALAAGSIDLPLCLRARTIVVPAVGSLRDYELWQDGRAGGRAGARLQALQELAAGGDGDDALDQMLKATARQAYESAEELRRGAAAYQPVKSYPGTGIGRSLELAARALSAPLGTRLVHVRQGGYDTHAGQARTHGALLQELSEALAAFAADLKAHGLWSRALVVVFSEFGRRVAENQSKGTDHGAAGPCFLLGGSVKGGVHGAMPSLVDLDDGDLRFSVDFRRVYREVLDGWLGLDARPILNGDFERLGIV